ncbi:MAG: hypothetical protein ABGY42_16355, partial [bacterium]
ADYGDSPDGVAAGYAPPNASVIGRFPTAYATTNSRYGLPGFHVFDSTLEHLGVDESLEIDASDPGDPDLIENFVDDDFDDGIVGGECPFPVPAGPYPLTLPVTLDVEVEVESGAVSGIRYLNGLIDLDHDGTWATPASPPTALVEWVVVDHPVNVSPGTIATVTLPAFLVPRDLTPAWARVTLTEAPITGSFTDDGSGWDGSGVSLRGEVEDHRFSHALAVAGAAANAQASASAEASASASATAIAAVAASSSVSCSGECCSDTCEPRPQLCYKTKARTAAAGMMLDVGDKFGPTVAQIKKPALYCVDANLGGEGPNPEPVAESLGAPNATQCFQIRDRGKRPGLKAVKIDSTTELASDQIQLRGAAQMLCLPAQASPVLGTGVD